MIHYLLSDTNIVTPLSCYNERSDRSSAKMYAQGHQFQVCINFVRERSKVRNIVKLILVDGLMPEISVTGIGLETQVGIYFVRKREEKELYIVDN